MPPTKQASKEQRSGRWKLLLIMAVCAAPLLGSYFAYYVIKPTGRTNYGALIDPRSYPIPPLGATTLDGKPTDLGAFRGKWIMLLSATANCGSPCQKTLLAMRQLRLMQGQEMERIERVWLITDGRAPAAVLMREFEGTRVLRVQGPALQAWLPVEAGGNAADRLYLIDPRGHLMMRFPKDADPAKVKNDIARLLKASAIG